MNMKNSVLLSFIFVGILAGNVSAMAPAAAAEAAPTFAQEALAYAAEYCPAPTARSLTDALSTAVTPANVGIPVVMSQLATITRPLTWQQRIASMATTAITVSEDLMLAAAAAYFGIDITSTWGRWILGRLIAVPTVRGLINKICIGTLRALHIITPAPLVAAAAPAE